MSLTRLSIYLLIGTLAMLIPILIQGAWYKIEWGKRVLTAILLTIAGTLGTFLLYYVENGEFGGTSFYGAVFFVPLVFIAVARIVHIPYHQLMDLCAPAECVMLAIMKVQCLTTKCCGGITISYADIEFVFPSQLAELINALIIGAVLLLMSRKSKNRGKVYPKYMVFYGITRFILNIFRKTKLMRNLFMPFGNFWSLISIAIGVIWLLAMRKQQKRFTDKD